MEQYKTCTKCGQIKSLERFSKHNGKKASKSGLRSTCKDCDKSYAKLYAAKNREKLNKSAYQWRKNNAHKWSQLQARSYYRNHDRRLADMQAYRQMHPEQARINYNKRRALELSRSIGIITSKDIRKMLSKLCTYCNSAKSEHVDHVIPLSRGGTHSLGNLTGACRTCNLSKGSKFVMEWKRGRDEARRFG